MAGLLKVLLVCAIFGAISGQTIRRPLKRPWKTTTTTTEAPRVGGSDDDEGSSDSCPEPNGFFADAEQCDKYYACHDGVITEKLCPDGMVFNDYAVDQEKCDLPFNLDCSQRSKLQEPQPTLNCPRQHGYFGHADKKICDQFFYCVDGKFNMITCPDGLVFNPKTGICTWPDEAAKKGCTSQDVFNFSCPSVNETFGLTHPRYADPDDCQFFYVCINGAVPRRNGCKWGQAFDDSQKRCEWARRVPECVDWYADRLTEAQQDELEFPKPATTTRKPVPIRRKQSRRPVAVVVDEEEEEE